MERAATLQPETILWNILFNYFEYWDHFLATPCQFYSGFRPFLLRW